VRQEHAQLNYAAPPGRSVANVPLPLASRNGALFYRLHYSISPWAGNLTAFYPQQGMLSFAQIAEHAFRLTGVGIGTPRLGRPFEFRVLAANPVTGRPVPGVEVTCEKISAKTDATGSAVIRVMPDADDWDTLPGNIDIAGRLGDLVQSEEAFHPALPPNAVRIYTDKPLYQAGQTLHMRMLATGPDGRAYADHPYSIRVLDERSTILHAEDVTTSRFGVAHTDWEIPANAQAGKYSIEVENEDDDRVERQQVEVRRYELPSFRVAVQPDRPFYLPGQSAAIEVRADYLFGKPVPGGKVRITEQDHDSAIREGTLDAGGRFRATLDLSAAAGSLKDQRYADQHFVAYVTDAGTNRTEQRRFDVRVSREPIHIYLIQMHLGRLYVATYTADGAPLPCDVETVFDGGKGPTARTNRYGVARIEAPPGAEKLVALARGPAGTASEDFDLYGQSAPPVRLETDHSLYREGQPIRCLMRSERQSLWGTLLAWNEDGGVVYSRAVQLSGGRGEFAIPYDQRFGRAVSVGLMSALGRDYQASRTVLYPGADELTLTVRPGKETYRPGEKASLALRASGRQGAPVEAALGIAVVDESVLERAATDQSMKRPRWFDCAVPRATVWTTL